MAVRRSKAVTSRDASRAPARPVKKTVTNSPAAIEKANWTFLTNHAHVLFLIAESADLVLREVAVRVGITERAVQRIIADLEREGFVERERIGRKNQYKIFTELPLRHPIESHRTIGELIALIARDRSKPKG